MSSSARAVFFGRPPGIFLLMKWITCSFSGGVPCVEGGAAVCALARPRSRLLAARCALKPTSTIAERITLIVSGLVALRNTIAALLAGRKLCCPILRSRFLMFIDTSPKSMSTGHGAQALVADGAVVGDVLELLPVADRDAAPRLLLVEEGLDQQRGRQDLVARAVEQVGARHVRRARRLALAAAQAVLDRRRDLADVALLHDERLVAHQAEARRVGVGQVGLQRLAGEARVAQQLALVEAALGVDAPLVVGERRELVVGQELELGDADAVLAGDHAVEAARQLHDAGDGSVRRLQHLVVVAVDGDVGVHVAVAGVHVQRHPDAAAQHLAVQASAFVEDRPQRGAGEDRLERRQDLRLPRGAPGVVLEQREDGAAVGAVAARAAGRAPPASRATGRRHRAAARAPAGRGPRAARRWRSRSRRRPSRAAGRRSRRTPRGDRRGPACWPG